MIDTSDKVTFNIKEASKLVEVTPATIRNWEKSELIKPQRMDNGYRVYTMADIKRLQVIKKYSIDERMSISAIKSLIGRDYSYITEEQSSSITKKMLGDKWKQYRIKKGYSLSEVAQSIDITPSYLSKIESAQANTSFEILEKLAHFYGENLLYYFQNENNLSPVANTGKNERFSIGLEGVVLTARNTLPSSKLTVMTYTIEAQKGRHEASSHHGEEFIYILEGQVEFTLDEDKIYHLGVGDSLHFNSAQKHKWYNPSKSKIAKMLWVYTVEEQ